MLEWHSNNMHNRHGSSSPGKASSLSRRSSQQGRPAAQPSAHLKAKPTQHTAPKPPTKPTQTHGKAVRLCRGTSAVSAGACWAALHSQEGEAGRRAIQCMQGHNIDVMSCGHGPVIHPSLCRRDKAGTKQGRSHGCPTPGSWLNHRCQQRCPAGKTGKKLSQACC